MWYSMGGVLFFQVFVIPPPPPLTLRRMFLIKVPEEGRFLAGGIHRTRVGGDTGMAGGASRDSMRRIFPVMSVVFVMACRPRHQDDCLVERMGIVGKGWGTVCVVLHLGHGRHVAGSRKLETMGLHKHPHPHVSRFLGSRRRRAGSGCIYGPYRRLIAVLSTRGYVKQQPTVL